MAGGTTGGEGGGAGTDTGPPGADGAAGSGPVGLDASAVSDVSTPPDGPLVPDAAPPALDAPPASAYPAGPYGFAVGNTMLNASFSAADGAIVTLAELRALAGTKVIVWSSGAEWCPVCRSKVPALKRLQTDKGPQGVVVIESLHQSSNFTPANAATVDRWNRQYQVNYRLVVEKSPPYAQQTQNPLIWVIDAATMKIRAREQYSSADVGPEVDAALAAAGR
jgi:hypothetical protein